MDKRISSILPGQLLGPLRLPALLAAAVLLLLVGLLVFVAWRGLVRLEPVQNHIEHLSLLRDLTIAVEQVLVKSRTDDRPVPKSEFEALPAAVAKLIALDRHRAEDTPKQLRLIERLLSDDSVAPNKRLSGALTMLRGVLVREQEAQAKLLQDIDETARFEFELAIVLLFAIPVAALCIAYLLRDRVWRPLDDLALLLRELSVQEYRQIPSTAIAQASPALEPVYRNYNTLVARLRSLEEEHRRREHTLEQEVREATATLLDLNRQLAESERLAAVGALSAGLAHELRNPLAGVRMACGRLRDHMTDPAQVGRINLVMDEIDRLNQLLTNQLAEARHAPEPAIDIGLKECVETLLSLVRYQVPERVSLDATVAEDVRCRLPVGQLRQALLN
ncbi:MAG: histidine kinase dimerization/phospho-acceptor domain-containing protein, partial [Gemmatimonadales bacterium]